MAEAGKQDWEPGDWSMEIGGRDKSDRDAGSGKTTGTGWTKRLGQGTKKVGGDKDTEAQRED